MMGARVLGWDVLRGVCALAVASYHLLLWLDIAALHTFGSYGVYLFFVLSGASLGVVSGCCGDSGFSATERRELGMMMGGLVGAGVGLIIGAIVGHRNVFVFHP